MASLMKQSTAALDYPKQLSADRIFGRMDSSRHFEGDSRVFATMRNLAARLDQAEVPYAIAGAMALFEHGVRRFTDVVDILVTPDGLKTVC